VPDKLPGKASEQKAVLFLRQVAYPTIHLSRVNSHSQYCVSSRNVRITVFVSVVVVQFEYLKLNL
jgi:hypothetical protein